MGKYYVIMDETDGTIANGNFETWGKAQEWIDKQIEDFRYDIIEVKE